jgi:ATP-dependent helicase YprA (DUF1998 family)
MSESSESGNNPDRTPDDSLTPTATEAKGPEAPLPAAPAEAPHEPAEAPIAAAEPTHEESALVGPLTPLVPESFDDFGLVPALHSAILRMGWLRPTPVQQLTFNPMIAGEDVMVQSHTGSGKTGAFCVPWLASRFEAKPASRDRRPAARAAADPRARQAGLRRAAPPRYRRPPSRSSPSTAARR